MFRVDGEENAKYRHFYKGCKVRAVQDWVNRTQNSDIPLVEYVLFSADFVRATGIPSCFDQFGNM